ncbi:MAG: hypothetical protein LAN84_02570 [Acidobacteriia bacterium]|nr:hypothetical protein [Terriglobia bacterium]
MNTRPRYSTFKWFLAIGFAVALVCVGIFVAKNRMFERFPAPSLKIGELRETPEWEHRPRLYTTSVSDSLRVRLLDGEFSVLPAVNEIPQDCRSTFNSAFTYPHVTTAESKKIELANPDEMFQDSDALVPGLPFRRLVFAGARSDRCFIYYQHGGTMYPRFCLAVMDNIHGKMLWVGESRKQARHLEELRLMLLRNDFLGTTEPTC